jgi:hypothetical protein
VRFKELDFRKYFGPNRSAAIPVWRDRSGARVIIQKTDPEGVMVVLSADHKSYRPDRKNCMTCFWPWPESRRRRQADNDRHRPDPGRKPVTVICQAGRPVSLRSGISPFIWSRLLPKSRARRWRGFKCITGVVTSGIRGVYLVGAVSFWMPSGNAFRIRGGA